MYIKENKKLSNSFKNRGFTRTPKNFGVSSPACAVHADRRSERGFTLLFASLVAALLLAVALAIYNIGSKELILSSIARDSQFAFYAADSGIECVYYWDFQHAAFAVDGVPNTILCDNQAYTVGGQVTYGNPNTFTINLSQGYCAEVTVTKYDSPATTIVESRGYNTCDTTNPRRVERALRATYH